MSNINIAAICGSIQTNSLNKKFLNALIAQAPEGVTVNIIDISKLPLYSQDYDADYPQIALDFKDKIKANDAILFVTPEHSRSIPAALKNALDWGSRPYGHTIWSGKPAAVTGATLGNVGTFGAQHHLRQILTHLNVYAMAQPEFYFSAAGKISDSGEITNDDTKALIDKYWSTFVSWINRFKD
jgi:chromate reductase